MMSNQDKSSAARSERVNNRVVGEQENEDAVPQIRSLKELIDKVTGRGVQAPQLAEETGLAETLPYPFLAIVGQREMKLALILALINPVAGGVLLIGPRGTGKTTAVRSMTELLPRVPRSLCYYGCLEEDIESGGIEAVCPDCARKYGEGEALSKSDRVRLVELPLNARIENVIGGMDERALVQNRFKIQRGLLAQADRNLLYVDEINLLADEVVDALLDASAQGHYSVRRGPVSATYHSRFVLIGSMNPEEGWIRPQIQDRFGLRVIVRGLEDVQERLDAYRLVRAYRFNAHQLVGQFARETEIVRSEIQAAREILPEVTIEDEIARIGINLIDRLQIDSLRAEITFFESARAYAAAEGRRQVIENDLREVAPMALRLRRSEFMQSYFAAQSTEEEEMIAIMNEIIPSQDITP
jgi:magnesium chelatase subunit I